MSVQYFGFYFSCNTDKSANDYTVYAELDEDGDVKLSIRYKNAEPNSLYQITMDANDLNKFGKMCCDMAMIIIDTTPQS